MVRFGIWLLVLGIGGFILPMVGMQFTLLSLFGDDKAPYVGGGMAVVGLILVIAGSAQGQSASTSSAKESPEE